MGVDDGLDIRSSLIDFATDEAFKEDGASTEIDRIAVLVKFDNVIDRNQRRRHGARH